MTEILKSSSSCLAPVCRDLWPSGVSCRSQTVCRCWSSWVWIRTLICRTPAFSSDWTSSARGFAGRSVKSWRSKQVRRTCGGRPQTSVTSSRWRVSYAAPRADWIHCMRSCRSWTHTSWSKVTTTAKVRGQNICSAVMLVKSFELFAVFHRLIQHLMCSSIWPLTSRWPSVSQDTGPLHSQSGPDQGSGETAQYRAEGQTGSGEHDPHLCQRTHQSMCFIIINVSLFKKLSLPLNVQF